MKVLAISAHSDDETLGCWGSLLRCRAQNDQLHWLIVTQTRDRGASIGVEYAKAVMFIREGL